MGMEEKREGKAEMAHRGRENGAFALNVAARPAGLADWLLGLGRWWRKRELRDRRQEARRQLEIVESLSLGSRRELLLVSCAGERFLVGTGAEGVQTMVRVGSERAFGNPTQKVTEERRWG